MVTRVLVVDDSAVMRSFIREILDGEKGIKVVGVASDPFTAREKIKIYEPDVITLDIEMPGMDGLTFLEHLMRLRPMPVVMVSSGTTRGAASTIKALELGAVDFVAKPSDRIDGGWAQFTAEVIAKVKIAASTVPPYQTPAAPGLTPLTDFTGRERIVALGGSTGAVAVVQHVLAALPEKMPPMLVAVHMPAQFTRQFANRLNKICRLEVVEAEHGMALVPGRVIIAPGERHLTVAKSGTGHVCRVEEGPRVNGHVPSVDVLFESLAGVAGEAVMGIVLTGMGRDGALGLKAIRAAGGITACQDEASSLIYGMPRAAAAEGAVMHQRGLKDLAAFILEHAQRVPAS